MRLKVIGIVLECDLDIKTSDNELAVRASDGDRQAYGLLLERHYDRIFRIALRFTGLREDAEDVTQEVCMSLANKLQSFRGEASFTTWLYRVVVNRVRDVQRKQITAERFHKEFGEVDELRREEAKAQALEFEWLYEMLNGLSDDLRETAILVTAEGLSHAQAGDILGVKETTISWRMHELKKQLRQIAKENS